MSKPTHYAAVSSPGTKKVAICARRVGSRERLATIATCNTEDVADKIVDALNLMQDKIEKLSLPVERQLETAKESIAAERRLVEKVRKVLDDERSAHSHTRNAQATTNRELTTCRLQLEQLRKELAELKAATTQPA